MGTRRPIAQSCGTALAEAADPLGGALSAELELGRGRVQAQLPSQNSLGELLSTVNRESRMMMVVHSVSWLAFASQHQLPSSRPNGQQPIETSHLGPRIFLSPHLCNFFPRSFLREAHAERLRRGASLTPCTAFPRSFPINSIPFNHFRTLLQNTRGVYAGLILKPAQRTKTMNATHMSEPILQIPNDPSAVGTPVRCHHRWPSGRRCRQASEHGNSNFCSTHAAVEQNRHNGDRLYDLLQSDNNLLTAREINKSLASLYMLLAEDKISARRAAVLAYVSSL